MSAKWRQPEDPLGPIRFCPLCAGRSVAQGRLEVNSSLAVIDLGREQGLVALEETTRPLSSKSCSTH
jgi:hypothetical protein